MPTPQQPGTYFELDRAWGDTQLVPLQPLLELVAAIEARASEASYNQPPEVCEALLNEAGELRKALGTVTR